MSKQSQVSSSVANDQRNSIPAPVLAGLRILLVEDEVDIAHLFTFVLEEREAEVMQATSAAEALLVLDQQQPDLMVCNVRLPDHDGTWLIQQVRAHATAQQLPAIAVTSFQREVDPKRMLEAGFQAFLPKPIDPDELVIAVLHLAGRA